MAAKTMLSLSLLVLACDTPEPGVDGAPAEFRDVMTVTANLDLLLVIDDSGTMADKQGAFQRATPALLGELAAVPGGLPNLHLGVISTDMGTKASGDEAPGPRVGQVGQGGCADVGKGGNMLVNNAPIVTRTDGTQPVFLELGRDGTANFTGTLDAAVATMSQLGAAGCGFEQPLHAMRTALDANPANAGFLRASANLGVVVLTDEDDCSLLHTSLLGPEDPQLGPQQSFRCFRFGVTCAEPTSTLGAKTACKPDAASPHVEDVTPFQTFLTNLKGDPRRVMFGAILAEPTSVAVENRTINGSTQPALAHSCDLRDANNNPILVGDPAIRLRALADRFGGRSRVESICATELVPQVTNIGRQLADLMSDRCIPETIASGTECVVDDRRDSTTDQTTLLRCSDEPGDCFRIVSDAACSAGQRLEILRETEPPADTYSTLQCRLSIGP